MSSTVSKHSNGSVDTNSKLVAKNSADAVKSPLKKSTSDIQKLQTSPKNTTESKFNQSNLRNTTASSVRSTSDTTGVSKLARSSSAKSINIPLKSLFSLSSVKVSHGESSNGENIKNSQMDIMGSGDNCETLDKQKILDEMKSKDDKKNQQSGGHVENGQVVSAKSNGEEIVNGSGEHSKIATLDDEKKGDSANSVITVANEQKIDAGDNKPTNKPTENGNVDECYVPNGNSASVEDKVNVAKTVTVEISNKETTVADVKSAEIKTSDELAVTDKHIESPKDETDLKDEVKKEKTELTAAEVDQISETGKSPVKAASSPSDLSPSSSESEISKETSSQTVVVDDHGVKAEETESNVKDDVVTKQSIRLKIWDHLESNNLVLFPRPCQARIPNFVGAPQAAEKLSKLDIFKNSKIIKVNPDKPQEAVRFLTLEYGKRLLVPVPRLRQGLFQAVIVPANANQYIMKNASQQVGMVKYSKPVRLDDHIHIDLIVLGSVAVDTKGHRIGKGEGYADLEFALMMKMNAVNENTVIATTVHDDQVVDDLPEHLFKDHDVPVDWIITPTRVIEVSEKLARPRTIIWDILSQRRVLEIPILQFLRERELSEGKECALKEIDSDTENKPFPIQTYRRYNNRRRRVDYSHSTGDPKRDFQNNRYPSQNRYSRNNNLNNINNTRNVVNTNRYPSARRGGVSGGGGGSGYYRPNNGGLGGPHMGGGGPMHNQWSSYNYRQPRNGPQQSRNGPPLQQRNGPLHPRNGGPLQQRNGPRNQSSMDRRPRNRSVQRMDDDIRPRSRTAGSRQRIPSYNNRRRSSARLSADRKKSTSPEQDDHSPVDVPLQGHNMERI